MKLSADDKHNVKAIWEHVKGHEEAIGAEALCRMFTSLPTTRTYFPTKDIKEGSSFLHSHGKKVMGALSNAVAHIDDIDGALSKLSDKHAEELMVDPANFPKLAHNILVVLGIHLKPHLTYSVHSSVDKFLATVGYVLASKYR
uniref:Hemoglobin subunit alpha-1 n=1 Tax=Triturus cristatus TaxID=8323 RepID=HBA1_TRICR|nr:RecName: Full=Hemoglobin subunit alpha-1; AltName: Full=Alpha-1-globin; AltName: Full=Hemoglobin alpha-1 chain; AltName: Full=Hemoglobin alpha-major chain [Triturus cristatus]